MLIRKTGVVAVASGLLLLSSCQKSLDEQTTNDVQTVTPTTFDFATSVNTNFSLVAPSALRGATFKVFTKNPLDGGKLIGQGQLNNNASFNGAFIIPSSLKTVFIQSTYIGLPTIESELVNGKVQVNYALLPEDGKRGSGNGTTSVVNNTVFQYMGTYNSAGVPNYLITPDVVDADFLADINASLPSTLSVPVNNPHYLASGNATSLELSEEADVWITFVGEGAGYRNTLAYYTYDITNPPATKADIDQINIIFPNVSAAGSGGGLKTGDKVFLGKFPAKTGIGWTLIQNAYNGSSVNVNKVKFYSNVDFNPETDPSRKRHNVQLIDQYREKVIIGFEDLHRQYPGNNANGYSSDDDFEDAVFYATVVPFSAIDQDKFPKSKSTLPDKDGDGVPDSKDDYPEDPNKAFNNFTPFEGGFSSIAFEDLWPSKGDYDFNDLVMNCNYNHITNANNEVVALEYKLKVRHIGATYHNGFGIQWPFASSDVSNVSGFNHSRGLVSTNANGTEANQAKATVIVFEDAFDYEGQTLTITADLETPYEFTSLVNEGLNPFIFVNAERGREVHLPGHSTTDLFDFTPSGSTQNDGWTEYRSHIGEYPWAINISHAYAIPAERVAIDNCYLKFEDWVKSKGKSNTDWYEEKPGYRNNSNMQ